MKNTLLFSVLIFFLTFFHISHANSLENAVASNIASNFFSLMKSNNFQEASSLFHYPPHYSAQELSKDTNGVATILEIFQNEFGEISNPAINNEKATIASLQVGGGDLPYWKNHPNFVSVIYRVNFAKFGNGFVTFTFSNIGNKFQIREVKYGLLSTRKDTQQLLKKVAEKLMSLFAPNSTV